MSDVNVIALRLFLVTWGCYLISQAFFMFGAISSFVSAAMVPKEWLKSVLFLVSCTFYALGQTCEYGGLASAYNSDSSLSSSDQDLESSSAAATVFFFFAAIPAAVSAGFASKANAWVSTLCFNLFLGLIGLGFLCVYGGESRSAYSEEKNANDDSVKSAEKSKYQGYAFAGFAAAMAMLTGFIFAALLLKSREVLRAWLCWFTWATLFFLAQASSYASEAQAWCKYSDSDSNHSKLCQGYSAGAFFVVLAFVISIVGIVFTVKVNDELKACMFMVSWSFFALGTACVLGGNSAYDCSTDDDFSKTECGGYGGGTFFAILGFLSAGAGVYFAQKGGTGTGSHAQMEDDDPKDTAPDYSQT